MPRPRFGSSGLRGPYPETVNAPLMLQLGHLIGHQRQSIVVGHDARTTSPMLAAAFAAGAQSQGATVFDAGLAPTPTVAYAGREHNAAAVITASHNPPPDNGLKLWNPNGAAWSPQQASDIAARLAQAPPPGVAWDTVGNTQALDDAPGDHARAVAGQVGDVLARCILDCANGAGGVTTPLVLLELGVAAKLLNAEPDGRSPNRPSEPLETNLSTLAQQCNRLHLLGLAHDGDADRIVCMGRDGHLIPNDALLVLLARHEAARSVVVPIDTGLTVAQGLADVDLHYCRVGDAYVSQALIEHKGQFGGEASGTWIWPRFRFTPDGVLGAAKILELDRTLGGIEHAAAALPTGHLTRTKRALDPADTQPILDAVADLGRRTDARTTRLDGVRLDWDDGWCLVRPSGTEPVLRVSVEATTQARAQQVRQQLEHAMGTSRQP